MIRVAAILIVAVLTFGAARAADSPPLHPLSTAAAIRAARNATPGPELQLSFLFLDEKTGESPRTIGVGDGYAYLLTATTTTVFDFKLRRMIAIDRVAQTFSNESLHGLVASRTLELDDRVDEYKSRKSAATPKTVIAEPDEPFWIETETGLVSTDLPRSEFSRAPFTSGGVQFRYRGAPVARFTPAEIEITDPELATLTTFLRHTMPIHPEIFAAMVEFHKAPSVISFSAFDDGQKNETQYRLRGVRRTTADYPLADDFHPAPIQAAESPAFVKELLPVIAEAVAGRYAGGPRTPENYRRTIAAGFDAGPDLGTVLTYIEFISNYGPRVVSCPSPPDPAIACHTIKEVIDRATTRDLRVRPYVTGIFGQTREPDRVVETWSKLKKDDLPNAYVMDMAMANALSLGDADSEKAEALYAGVIKGNAYLAGVYRDIGDTLMRRYDASSAWLFYDTGRALPGNTVASLLDQIDGLEQRLMTEYPEFY